MGGRRGRVGNRWCSKDSGAVKMEKKIKNHQITINRPERRNAFRPHTVKELIRAFNDARDDSSIGVIILTGKSQTPPICGPDAVPSWKLNGTVKVATSGQKQGGMILIVPEGRHALRLGNDAQISQGVKLEKGEIYSITFSASRTCAQLQSLNVSVPLASQTIDLQTLYSVQGWDTYAWAFQADQDDASVVFTNPGIEDDPTSGPIIDDIAIKKLFVPTKSKDNASRMSNTSDKGTMFGDGAARVCRQLRSSPKVSTSSPLVSPSTIINVPRELYSIDVAATFGVPLTTVGDLQKLINDIDAGKHDELLSKLIMFRMLMIQLILMLMNSQYLVTLSFGLWTSTNQHPRLELRVEVQRINQMLIPTFVPWWLFLVLMEQLGKTWAEKDYDEFQRLLFSLNLVHSCWLEAAMEGISLIATFIGKPVMLDSYTSSMCNDSWGRSSFAWFLIKVCSEDESSWMLPFDGFQTVGKKKKRKGKSKSTNGGQFTGPSVKHNTTGDSSKKDNLSMSNSFSVLNEEEEDVENVYDESANLIQNTKAGGSSSFTTTVGHARDMCKQPLAVMAFAGDQAENMHYTPNGNSTFQIANVNFTAKAKKTRVAFYSVYYNTKSDDLSSLCGPVADDIRVVVSAGGTEESRVEPIKEEEEKVVEVVTTTETKILYRVDGGDFVENCVEFYELLSDPDTKRKTRDPLGYYSRSWDAYGDKEA
ncbi:carbohydrate binding domain-containing protein precursor [Tanacetum coccineum]